MKRIITIFSLAAAMVLTASNLFAVGCATECSLSSGGTATGYCTNDGGPEGGNAECTLTGVGSKSCDGTYEPLICDPT